MWRIYKISMTTYVNHDLVVTTLRYSVALREVISDTVGVPTPTLLGILGSNPYGIDVGKLVAMRDSLVPESVMRLTLCDIVGGAISDDEAVRARYLKWIEKAKHELAGAKDEATKEAIKGASDVRKELAAAKKKTVARRAPGLVQELKATEKKLDAMAKTADSIRLKFDRKKIGVIRADQTPIAEILSNLLGRMGITEQVAYLSALVRHADETRSVTNGEKSSGPNSLGELAAQASSGPSLISILSKGLYFVRNAMSAKAVGGSFETGSKCTTIMGVIVCDDPDAQGTGHPEGASFGRRYVIHTDPMTLERGPGFRVDAFDVLDKSLAAFEIATTNLMKDKDHARAYVMTLLNALAEAFKMPASHQMHQTNDGHSKKAGGGSSSYSKTVKITTTTGGCAMCAEEHVAKLEKLGIVQTGGQDKIVYVQQVPSADQQRANQQYLKNDTYASTCLGCLVFIDACECLMECGDYLE